ncbi:MAG: Ig-like domain-containing protein [Bacteroidales bacterium]|nr:Ig-like domain-containing protein [Bacteroidales bacterium]
MKQRFSFAILLTFLFSLSITSPCRGNTPPAILSANSAWSLFSEPVSVYYEGTKKQTYFAFVDNLGNVIAASYNHDTEAYVEKVVKNGVYTGKKDIASPSILIRGEGEIMLFFQDFTINPTSDARPVAAYVSTNKEDISQWTSLGSTGYGDFYYPCTSSAYTVGNDIYMSFRGKRGIAFLVQPNGNNPEHANYNTLSNATTQNNRFEFYQTPTGSPTEQERLLIPYVTTCQDSEGTIHLGIAHSHPDYTGANNNVIHYLQLKDKKFYTAAGGNSVADLKVNSIPLGTIYDKIYEPTEITGNKKSWVWDICMNENKPTILYSTFNADGSDYAYNYAAWNGTEWVTTKIADAGGIVDAAQPYLAGGITFDSKNPHVVYLSKKESTGTFEIYKYITTDNGATWIETEALTSDTPEGTVNIRPVSVQNYTDDSPIQVCWMRGTYTSSNEFSTSLVIPTEEEVIELTQIELDEESLTLKKGDTRKLNPTLTPVTATNKNVTWQSSAPTIVSVDQEGEIACLEVGTATITVKAESNPEVNATCVVTVEEIGNIDPFVLPENRAWSTLSKPVSIYYEGTKKTNLLCIYRRCRKCFGSFLQSPDRRLC